MSLRTIVSPPPVWRELRFGLEMRALLRDERFREPREAPESRAVMLIPGFLTGDQSLRMLGSWLKRSGHRTRRAGMRLNVDCSEAAVSRLEQCLERFCEAQGESAFIVGQSRGGTFARVLAVRRPDLVRGIVTLGSPHVAPLAVHPIVWVQGAALATLGSIGVPGIASHSCLTGDCCKRFTQDLRADFPIQGALRRGLLAHRRHRGLARLPRSGRAAGRGRLHPLRHVRARRRVRHRRPRAAAAARAPCPGRARVGRPRRRLSYNAPRQDAAAAAPVPVADGVVPVRKSSCVGMVPAALRLSHGASNRAELPRVAHRVTDCIGRRSPVEIVRADRATSVLNGALRGFTELVRALARATPTRPPDLGPPMPEGVAAQSPGSARAQARPSHRQHDDGSSSSSQ